MRPGKNLVAASANDLSRQHITDREVNKCDIIQGTFKRKVPCIYWYVNNLLES